LEEREGNHATQLLRIPGIVGIGIGLTADGKDLAFIVYVENRSMSVMPLVPQRIEDVPVRIIESNRFRAY
jgi:hypothetical protein